MIQNKANTTLHHYTHYTMICIIQYTLKASYKMT